MTAHGYHDRLAANRVMPGLVPAMTNETDRMSRIPELRHDRI